MRSPRVRSGLALLLVVGVLGVLAMLGAAFVILAQAERRASRQRLLHTQAELLARSGLEDALARLSAGQDPSLLSTRYFGEDWNADGAHTGWEDADEVVRDGIPDRDTCPVGHAMRPSFSALDGLGTPLLSRVDGRRRGLSGRTASGEFSLKVEDESGKINVNGGLLDLADRDLDSVPDHKDADVRNPADPQDTGRGWNFQLARVLNVLGTQPGVGVMALGAQTLALRPPGGWASVKALQDALGTSVDLSPFLTVSSWSDPGVIHPNDCASGFFPAQSEVKKARRVLVREDGGRPPVNLNAAPLPVLRALLIGLSGQAWDMPDVDGIPTELTPAQATAVADLILARRDLAPFRSWSDFHAFCDALVPGVISGFAGMYPHGGGDLAVTDLIKSNFDPNTRSAKELPDQLVFRWVDKTDLTTWSTEGSLGPTGRFRVSCQGRVTDPSSRLLARAEASLRMEAFRPLRQSSQADFVAGRTDLSQYLSRSGADLTTGATASWNTWGPGIGLTAMSYPCPPQSLPGLAADYDGALALATVQSDHFPPTGGALRFLHHFDDSWDADAGSWPALVPHADNPGLQPSQWNRGVWPTLAGEEPNTLYPDGMHAQRLRSPAFRSQGNLPQVFANGRMTNRVGISYWAKSMTEGASRPTVEFLCSRKGLLLNQFQTFLVGSEDTMDPKGLRYGCVFESRLLAMDAPDRKDEYVASRGRPAARRTGSPFTRWRLVTAYVNSALPSTTSVTARVDAGPASMTQVWDAQHNYLSWDLGLVEDLLTGAGLGSCFFLGMASSQLPNAYQASAANSVLDEFALYDFSDAAACDAWASIRAKEGRYYKGADAWFLSGALYPAGGDPVRILSADWTEYLPRESRMEYFPTLFSADYHPRLPDPILADDASGNRRAWIEVEFLSAAGALLQPLSQGGRIDRLLPGMRYRVRFKTDLEDPVDQPLLETPWFDDITFRVQPAAGPKVLEWDLD